MDTTLSEKVATFFTQFKPLSFKKGEMLVRADDSPPGVFYLQSGTVKKYAVSEKGEDVTINIFKPKAFFPMSWAMNNTPNSYYYESVTDVAVRLAPKEKVLTFAKTEPAVLYDLLKRVYRGTDGMESRMVYLMAGSAYERLITELIIHAQRFGEKENDAYEFTISEKELAAQIGTTRETVSREIRNLKRKGLVQYQKSKLTIKSLQELQSEISF